MFIVLEGLDGAGKSTQVRMLRQLLSERGVESEYVHFPRFDAPVYGELIARFLVRKGVFEFFLPDGILPVNKPILILSCCIKFYQIFCNFFNCPPNLCLRLCPLLSSKTVKFWFF